MRDKRTVVVGPLNLQLSHFEDYGIDHDTQINPGIMFMVYEETTWSLSYVLPFIECCTCLTLHTIVHHE